MSSSSAKGESGGSCIMAGVNWPYPFWLEATSQASQADYMLVQGISTMPDAVPLIDSHNFNLLRFRTQADFPSDLCDR